MASVHPSEAAAGTSQDLSNDHCSAPCKDAESKDAEEDGNMVWRSKEKLAKCLACDLCGDILRDPVTAPECMHSFCRDCIDQHVLYGGTKNICPVCKKEGLQTVFGPQPFQHGKLQFDPMLADMTRKLFPRADVEQSIKERHDAEAQFRASIAVKKQKIAPAKTPAQNAPAAAAPATQIPPHNVGIASTVSPPQLTASPLMNAKVGLFLQTMDSTVTLSLPYLWVQQAMPVKCLCSFILSQLRLDSNVHHLQLDCEGSLLQPNSTLQSLSRQWYSRHATHDLIVVSFRIERRTASPESHL